ncbi:MAG: HAD family phosphatase [Oscillospiraceae bacterium]|nr:HAD family phosphatase [Oscillospiraceae bacterium]
MPVKLIAFDLDGTLFDDRKQLPQENIAALRAAGDAGILLVPATGRILQGLPDQLLQLGLFRYFIFANGASVYDLDTETQLFSACIPPELAVRICEHMDTLPVLYDCYRGEWGYMTQWMYEAAPDFFALETEILKLVRRLRKPVPELKENIREVDVPLEKLQMYFRPEQMAERERQLLELPRLFPEIAATSSLKNNIEINSIKAGKGRALLELCAQLGIAPEDTVAFGDGLNDADMLEAAGYGAAMENAADAVKQKADAVIENNNDAGVGKEIFRLLS